jgi:23S rRNA (cytosine1962-C5)-methyltransferase
VTDLPHLVLHEDDDLLVVNKPAGWNTHAPSPHANEGVYEWLRHREPRWATLAIVHRLDKETSGLLVFTKTPAANKSLTTQFTARTVLKAYLLLTDRKPRASRFSATGAITRIGDRYASRPGGQPAETRFEVVANVSTAAGPRWCLRAEPQTGRTHQIRVHAADEGIPILGDTLYGGTAAERVFLHAASIAFQHPSPQAGAMAFNSDPGWEAGTGPGTAAEASTVPAFVDPAQTDCYRMVHGASGGAPGLYVDRLGGWLLAQSEGPLGPRDQERLLSLMEQVDGVRGIYHKALNRRVRNATPQAASPVFVAGEPVPGPFIGRENGVQFELSFQEGYSVGLFLDQRDNRRRWRCNHVGAQFPAPRHDGGGGELLNTFAYTCGFSVAAALGGWRTTSLDLSKKYLEWGRRNFALNGIDAAAHDFVFGDTFDWLRRWGRRGRRFDAVILDPPTFSESKEHGRFQAEKDYGRLVEAALGVLNPKGVILASTNAARWAPQDFVAAVCGAIGAARRKVGAQLYVPQPPDFPITREEPAYLKTLWVAVG